MNLTKERAKEILKQYETDKALFNWCEEYKDFINLNVGCCLSSEIDYILKKSYEDNEAPLSYEDLDLFDLNKAKEHILYKFDELSKEEHEDFLYKINEDLFQNLDTEEQREERLNKYLETLNKEDLENLFNDLDLDTYEAHAEVYEWWFISDTLLYRLEEQGEVILNKCFWGRCTTGQHISLDYCCIEAFINLLKDRFDL